MQLNAKSRSASHKRSRKTLSLAMAASATAGLLIAQIPMQARAAVDSTATVKNGSTDLTAAASYTFSTGTALATSSDIVFASGVAYVPSAFTINTNINPATLNDLSSTALTIDNKGVAAATLTLPGGTNAVAPFVGDLLYVANGATLSIGTASTSALVLAITGNGNFDNAGTLNIASAINISTGKTINFDGAGVTTLTGTIAPATGTASLVEDGPGMLVDNVANAFAKMSSVTVTGGGTISTTASQANTTLPTALTIGGGGNYSEVGTVSTNTTDAYGAFTMNNGNGIVSIAGGSGFTTSLTVSKFNRSAGTTLLVRGTNLGQGTLGDGQFILSDAGASLVQVGSSSLSGTTLSGAAGTPTTLTIVPYLLGDISATGTGSNFVTYNSTLGFEVLDPGSQDTTLSAGYTTPSFAENVIGFNGTVSASGLTVNSLLFNTNGQTLAGSGGLTVNSGAIAVVGTSPTSDTIDSSFGSLTLGNGEGVLTATAGNTLTINAPISISGSGSGGLTLAGAGTVVLNASNNYSGPTTINGGTVTIGNANAFPSNTTLVFGNASTLNLGSFSPSVNNLNASSNSLTASTINLGTASTLTVSGALTVGVDLSPSTAAVNSALTITGGGALSVSGNVLVGLTQNTVGLGYNLATLDLTALSNVTLGGGGNNAVEVGVGGQNSGLLKLSNTANTISALALAVGDTNGASGAGPLGAFPNADTLILGNGTNVIAVSNLAIGSGVSPTTLANVTNKASGLVEFASQAPGGAGTLTLTNEGGGTGETIDIAYRGSSPGSSVNETGVLDLRGHSVSILNAGTINVAYEVNAGAGFSIGTLAFDTGNISATTVNVGFDGSTGSTANSTGNLNMGGGSLTVGTLSVGVRAGGGTGLAAGIVNVSGGTLTVTNGFTLGSFANAGTAAATLLINGTGTVLSNVSILQNTSTGTTGTITLNGGTLDLAGNTLGGTIPITNLNFQSGTLQNVSQINNGGSINKTTTGTLTINGANGYTGNTNISAGTVVAGNTNAMQNSTVNIGAAGAVNFASGLGSANFGGLAGSGNFALVDTANAPVALSVGSNNVSTAYSGGITGGGSLTKNGTGLLSLSGSSAYVGATTINTGGILVSGILGTTPVAVNGGAYLTGTGNGSLGVIGGRVTLASNAAIDFSKDLATGTAQKLTVGGLTLNGSDNLTFNLIAGGTSDTIASTGSLVLNGGQDLINLSGTFAPGTYTLLSYTNQTGAPSAGVYTNGAANSPFMVGTTPFAGSITYTFNDSSSALTLQVAVATSPVDYFYGAYARSQGGNGTSGSFGGTNGTITNFASNASGTNDAGMIPGANADVIFSATQSGTGGTSLAGKNISATLDNNYTINSLTVNSTPASTTIGGGGNLTINGGIDSFYTSGGVGILISAGAGPLTINTTGQLIVGGSQAWTNASASPFNVSSGVAGSATSGNVTSLTLTNSNTGNTSLSGTIADGGNGGQLALVINNTGAGVTQLTGSNSYTGGTTINSGVLQVGNANALGSSTSALTFGNASTGTLSLNGSNLMLTDLTTSASSVGTPVIQSGAGTVGVDTLTVNTTNTDTYAGVLQNGGVRQLGLTVGGAGTLILSGQNTYTGPTTINNGTVQVGVAGNASSGALGVASAVNIANNAGTTLVLNGFNTTIGSLTGGGTSGGSVNLGNGTLTVGTDNTSPAPYAGLITGTGGLVKVGTGNLTLMNNNTFTGGTIVNGGTLTLNGGGTVGALAGTLTINPGATVEVANYFSLGAFGGGVPQVSTVFINGGTLDGSIAATPGQIYLSAYTSYNLTGGMITSTGGTPFSLYNQTISTQASATQSVISAPLVIRAATTLVVNTAAGTAPGGDLLISGPINQTGISSLNKTGPGTLVLTNSNTYGGTTTVTAGQLVVGSSNALPAYAPTAANPISGTVTIAAGAQLTEANHGVGAPIAPSIGVLNNGGTVDLTNNALIVANASNTAYTTLSTQIVTGFAGGTWTGNNSTGASITSSIAAADTTHLTAVGIATGLTNFEGQSVSATSVLLKYTYFGDADLSGVVDGSDYSRIDSAFLQDQTNPGSVTGWFNGDFNYDGVINGSDYTLIDNAFNRQGAAIAAQIAIPTAEIAGGSATNGVPEPTSLALLAMGVAGLLGRRRARNR